VVSASQTNERGASKFRVMRMSVSAGNVTVADDGLVVMSVLGSGRGGVVGGGRWLLGLEFYEVIVETVVVLVHGGGETGEPGLEWRKRRPVHAVEPVTPSRAAVHNADIA
jgi:hypothetical protein